MNFKKDCFKIALLLGICVVFASCKKDNPAPDNNKKGLLSVEFDHVVGNKTLQLGLGEYKNASGENFTISELQYYISNIKVENDKGEEYIVPQDDSYFLVKAEDRTTRFAKMMVPEGNYTSLTFTLGVDSVRNTMDVDSRTGVLDPAGEGQGMYWSWNSGYVFFKMEGKWSELNQPIADQMFKYHIGGYGGYNPMEPMFNNIKVITIDLTKADIATVRDGYRSNIHLFVDVMKVFAGVSDIKIGDRPMIMAHPSSVFIANNFVGMFEHDHTENNVKSESEL